MKKALFATTALVLSAGVAAADVTISGYGRTGVQYNEGGFWEDGSDTRIQSRLRLNVDASTSTDQGVDFGARIRFQWNQGSSETVGSPAYLYVAASGLTVYVGNVPTAFDSAGLLYANDLGAFDEAAARKTNGFYAFSSGGYGEDNDRLGVAVEYSLDALTARFSYVDPDQSGVTDADAEYSVSVDYTWNDVLELSAAAVQNGEGDPDVDQYFLGASYGVSDVANVGLSYYDLGTDDWGTTWTLFGDYTLADGLTNIEAYVARNDGDENVTKTGFGIGVNYDLGGARLGASLQRDFDKDVYADLGVRFDF